LQEFPALERVAEKFAEQRLAVLTINSDRSMKTIKKVLDRVKTSLPVLREEESEVFEAYRAYAIPTIYLIGRQGEIYGGWTGPVDDLEAQLTDNINFVLKSGGDSRLAEAGTLLTNPPEKSLSK
jgi:peroxiredoxin